MSNYDDICRKINALKRKYPSLRSRTDDYIFSVLCIKVHFFKNSNQPLNENDIAEIIVDSPNDGGVDILLSDPNSEAADLVIGQSKFYKTISSETVLNAMLKMARFYKDMTTGHYENFNSQVKSRFLTLYSEVGEESKIHFVFYTSAPKRKSISSTDIEKKFLEQFIDSSAIDISILFVDDIVDEISAAESVVQIVPKGKIRIDDKDNYLLYKDYAAIVNVSARSIKDLYNEHGKTLLARNLRYYIKGSNEKKVDDAISKTIEYNSESFWLKNNGITIVCDDFRLDGREVHLSNFSIVNGGQTTYQISISKNINDTNDFYLTCKIIKIVRESEKDKDDFILEIAEATNSQKAIKNSDLISNAPEQRRFKQVLLEEAGIFYQTKRGDNVPKKYNFSYLHTKLDVVGKLCLAAIFQEPCKSRNNPSVSYKKDKPYYNTIFNGDRGHQAQVAKICRELLYIDYYFIKKFLPKFKRDNENELDSNDLISFASISRRTCVAFVALAARYHQGNITDKDITDLTSSPTSPDIYKMLRDLGDMKKLLPIELYTDAYKAALNRLFRVIIKAGTKNFSMERRDNPNLTPNSFLQNDKNYYGILKDHWDTLRDDIQEIFANV